MGVVLPAMDVKIYLRRALKIIGQYRATGRLAIVAHENISLKVFLSKCSQDYYPTPPLLTVVPPRLV